MDKPTAAPSIWPYPGHRTMAEVMAAEERERTKQREKYARERKSWRGHIYRELT